MAKQNEYHTDEERDDFLLGRDDDSLDDDEFDEDEDEEEFEFGDDSDYAY